jgi:uncharacterized membrane protein
MRYLLIALLLVASACSGERKDSRSDNETATPTRQVPRANEPETATEIQPERDPAGVAKARSEAEKQTASPKPKPYSSEGFRANAKGRVIDGGYARHLKTLFLEQGFRHEARWLNEDLKRDQGLDYQGFFFDADEGWQQPRSMYDDNVKQRVTSLRTPFFHNGSRVTEEEAFLALGYDVILIGDIDPKSAEWREEYWSWIESWTRTGGGLIFMAGMKFNPASYTDENARKLLPVVADPKDELIDTTQCKYCGATEEGFKHTILKLADKDERVRELLGTESEGKFKRGQLDGLYWYAGNLKPKEGATVLARVANEGNKIKDGAPLLVAMEYGKGRVLFVGSDDTHRWRQIVGEVYFYRFWRNAMAWAAKAEK